MLEETYNARQSKARRARSARLASDGTSAKTSVLDVHLFEPADKKKWSNRYPDSICVMITGVSDYSAKADVTNEETGELIDTVTGFGDLSNGIVRLLHAVMNKITANPPGEKPVSVLVCGVEGCTVDTAYVSDAVNSFLLDFHLWGGMCENYDFVVFLGDRNYTLNLNFNSLGRIK